MKKAKKSPIVAFSEAIIASEVGKYVIMIIANRFADCDNFDDAECILDQISGQEIEDSV